MEKGIPASGLKNNRAANQVKEKIVHITVDQKGTLLGVKVGINEIVKVNHYYGNDKIGFSFAQ
jgi:hypothetical protein